MNLSLFLKKISVDYFRFTHFWKPQTLHNQSLTIFLSTEFDMARSVS